MQRGQHGRLQTCSSCLPTSIYDTTLSATCRFCQQMRGSCEDDLVAVAPHSRHTESASKCPCSSVALVRTLRLQTGCTSKSMRYIKCELLPWLTCSIGRCPTVSVNSTHIHTAHVVAPALHGLHIHCSRGWHDDHVIGHEVLHAVTDCWDDAGRQQACRTQLAAQHCR